MLDLLIKNGEVYIDHHFVKANIGITGERITYIGNEEPKSKDVSEG